MQVLSGVKCMFTGHEDFIRSREQRVFLTCVNCGRETHGWELGAHDDERNTTQPDLSREARAGV